ncbi:MAG: DNA-directed RNA polymerase subunit alpha [Phycisphaeraceae bacterium]|nr:DNA-directed RNA polymerase subunit alpha [Phycisphaeraceae bacterium]
MRIRWRGLELPNRITPEHGLNTETYGKFVVEPFERGFGTTIGNSLRRILLSSLEGAAVTAIKIKGAPHEFTSLEGVMEDVTDIVLNVKNMVVSMTGDETRTMRLSAEGPGEVTCDLIEADMTVTIHNKDLVLATLTKEVDFDMEFTVQKGRGYVPASEQYESTEDQEVGIIPIDAIFSPVSRVRYTVEDTRVGQKTNYDKLTLEVWTNGTVTPELAMVEAAKVLRKHLNPFVQYFEMGEATASEAASAEARADEEMLSKLRMPLNELDLSVRASNCLESAKLVTVSDLVSRTEADLLKVRSFGKTSLREVKRKLADMNLELGMEISDELRAETSGQGS